MRLFNVCRASFIYALLSFSQVAAVSHDSKNEEKIYISAEALKLCDGMIAIQADDGIILTSAIFTDDDGVFVLAKDVQFLQEKELVPCGNGHWYNHWMDSLPIGEAGCPFCIEERNREAHERARIARKERAAERQNKIEDNQRKKKKR